MVHSYIAAISLFSIFLLNFYVVIRECYRRRIEVYQKTRLLLTELRTAANESCHLWKQDNYPHLYSPVSPCIALQWTYRDGAIVNLPWALLVRGDYIVMRSGHAAPGPCTEVNGKCSFRTNEVYGFMDTKDQQPVTSSMKPMVRTPSPDLICVLENTPYLDNLKLILLNSNRRPPTIYNQQRYVVIFT